MPLAFDRIIVAPGVADTGNMLRGTTKFFPDVPTVVLPPRQYGPVPLPFGDSYDESVDECEQLIEFELEKGGRCALLGYSAGAAASGNVAARGHRNLVIAGLVADPAAPKRNPGSTSWGITGSRVVPATRTFWQSDPADAICSCPANSPLRTLADQTAAMTFARPDLWWMDLQQRILKKRWQKVLLPMGDPRAIWNLYTDALDDLFGYLPRPIGRSEHTQYETRGYLYKLADQLAKA